MPLARMLEVEVMDTAAEAEDYNSMDHSAVNGAVRGGPAGDWRFQRGEVNVLDLGTGTALIPIELCRRTTHCSVLAVDLAAHMLELARKNVAAAGLASRIELQQIDAKALPFSDGRFDVVMSNSIIHHIPEPMHSLREAVRVTKSGGLLFFRDLLRPADEATLTLWFKPTLGAKTPTPSRCSPTRSMPRFRWTKSAAWSRSSASPPIRSSRRVTATGPGLAKKWSRLQPLLQAPQKRHQILLLLARQLELQHEVEELHRVVQRQQPVVVQVGRRILDAAEREGFDRAVGGGLAAVDHPSLKNRSTFRLCMRLSV